MFLLLVVCDSLLEYLTNLLVVELNAHFLNAAQNLNSGSYISYSHNLVEHGTVGLQLGACVELALTVVSGDDASVLTKESLASSLVPLDHGVDVVAGKVGVTDEGTDELVLAEETAKVNDKILGDWEVWEGANNSVLGSVCDASKAVHTVDVHGTGAANTLAARGTEGESGVLVSLHGGEEIKHHKVLLLFKLKGLDLLSVCARVEADDLEHTEMVLGNGGGTGGANHLGLVGGNNATQHFEFF